LAREEEDASLTPPPPLPPFLDVMTQDFQIAKFLINSLLKMANS